MSATSRSSAWGPCESYSSYFGLRPNDPTVKSVELRPRLQGPLRDLSFDSHLPRILLIWHLLRKGRSGIDSDCLEIISSQTFASLPFFLHIRQTEKSSALLRRSLECGMAQKLKYIRFVAWKSLNGTSSHFPKANNRVNHVSFPSSLWVPSHGHWGFDSGYSKTE